MLEVNGLGVSYGKARPVQDVSLTAKPGRITLVLGPNGAGKTTTLRTIAGLKRPDAGTVRLDGDLITSMAAHRLARRGLVLVPEGRRIFAPLTVEENLLVGGYTAPSKDRRAGLAEAFAMFPILEERRRGIAGLLSGGEQQMLAFGRAMMARPRYVLMDEPSMGLAPALVEVVLDAARTMADRGLGVLMVEQNAEAAMAVADELLVMDRGHIEFTGTVEDARRDDAVLRSFLSDAALRD